MGSLRGPAPVRSRDLQAFLDRVPFAPAATRRLAAPRIDGAGDARGDHPARNVDAGRLRRAAQRDCARARRRSPRASSPRRPTSRCRPISAPWVNRRGLFAREAHGGHVQERAHPVDFQLGVLAQGPAYRARHRRDESVHRCCRRSACRTPSTASGSCRSARSMIRSSRAASMRSITPAIRTPASFWWRRRRASRLAPEGGAHQSIARAADRHGAGWPRRLRAGLRRRACRDPRLRARLHSAQTATAKSPSAIGCATRPAARSICGCRRGRSSRSRAT